MSANKSHLPPAIETFEDELDSHIAESMQDPEYLAASIDVDRRFDLLKTLVGFRKKLALTQAQVARRMGVGQSTVSGFETEGGDPRLSTVQRYARAVEAECLVMIRPVVQCNWIAPAHVYLEHVESARNVRVDSTYPSGQVVAWAKRSDFALAG